MLGKELRIERVKKNFTLRTFAEETGIPIVALSNYELEKKQITIIDLKKICTVLNIDIKTWLEKLEKEDKSVYFYNQKIYDNEMQKSNLIFEKSKSMKKGEITEITCTCGGVMKIGKSAYNGHLRALCDKCDFVMIQ